MLIYNFFRQMPFNMRPSASLMINDKIMVLPLSYASQETFHAHIIQLIDVSIVFETNTQLRCGATRYRINFLRNRCTIRLEHRAVERVKGYALEPFLFPTAAPTWSHHTPQNMLYVKFLLLLLLVTRRSKFDRFFFFFS